MRSRGAAYDPGRAARARGLGVCRGLREVGALDVGLDRLIAGLTCVAIGLGVLLLIAQLHILGYL